MKHRLLALGLMIAGMSVGSAQPQQQPPAWAEKLFGPPANLVHDFGSVPRGAMLRHDFVMTNIYAVPIEITDVRVSMGCWGATPDKHQLQPNEKATISVWMDARKFTGQKTAAIFLTIGPTYISTVRLTISAVSRDDIVCSPGEVVLDSVAAGQTPSATVDIEYAGQLAWQVSKAVVPKEAPFEATVKELYRRPGQVGYQVKVSLKKDAAPGQFQENIVLKTNDPNAGMLPVLVRGNIQAPLEAVPDALKLKEMKSR
jgi:hypothetical protein